MTRTVAVSLAALVLLLLLAAAFPAASVVTVGPVEAAICLDESGRGHAQHVDMLTEPLLMSFVDRASALWGPGVPALVPKVRSQTIDVLRL